MELARRIAGRLGRISGVVAVALGGSWARGEAHPGSDLDLGIYYESNNPPPVGSLRELAGELDDRHLPELVTERGAWGPWINGGGWLRIESQRVDWLYRDLDRVASVLQQCRSGRPACYYQPGHPHGFHNHIYVGELHYCLSLYDPDGKLAGLKALTVPYPQELRRALIETFLWEAEFALETARKAAGRDDIFYVVGCLFRCVACLVQVLFALNETYFVNEKSSVRRAGAFARGPSGFQEIVCGILAHPGEDADQLVSSIGYLDRLLLEVREVCAAAG